MKKKNNIKVILNTLVLVFAMIIFYMSINGLLSCEVLYMGIVLGILIFINLLYIRQKNELINYIFIILNIIGCVIFSYLIIVECQLKVK